MVVAGEAEKIPQKNPNQLTRISVGKSVLNSDFNIQWQQESQNCGHSFRHMTPRPETRHPDPQC